MHILTMGLATSFVLTLISIGQKALTFQRIAVVVKKLRLMTLTLCEKTRTPCLLLLV